MKTALQWLEEDDKALREGDLHRHVYTHHKLREAIRRLQEAGEHAMYLAAQHPEDPQWSYVYDAMHANMLGRGEEGDDS